MRDPRPIVLVVEDDEVTRELFAEILGEEMRVILARDAEEARRILVQERPNLMVLDLGLPGRNGIEMLQAMKAEPATRDIPIVVVTGSPRRLDGAGVRPDAVVVKPFSLEDLWAQVQRAAPACPVADGAGVSGRH